MIITYHEIASQPARSARLYTATLRQLREHLEFIRARIAEGRPPLAITFDDGLSSHAELAAGELESHGFRGTFFVTPKWTGMPGYMDWPQLRQLVAAGHQVQSHGWSHQLLPRCGPEDLRIELTRSKELLEQRLGAETHSIAFPGGACNAAIIRACGECGYRRVYTSDPWRTPKWAGGVVVTGRLMIRNSTTASQLEKLLATERRLISLPRMAYLSRRAARATIGLTVYHALWSIVARGGERPQGAPRQ